MDGGGNFLQETILQNLNSAREGLLSEDTQALLKHHILGPSSPLHTLRRTVADAMSNLLQPVADRVAQAFIQSPDFVVVAATVLVVLLAVQGLLLVRRFVAWLTSLVIRLVFWSCVIAAAAVAWQRGPDKAVMDLVAFVARLSGYVELVFRYTRDVWLREYERYEAQQSLANGAAQGVR